jgi:hypothetical protein
MAVPLLLVLASVLKEVCIRDWIHVHRSLSARSLAHRHREHHNAHPTATHQRHPHTIIAMSARTAVASSTTITTRAYMKLILHASKYQTRSITGLLIASAPTAAVGASSAATVVIDDVIPLFHTTPLAPMIELALAQAESSLHASSTIVGVYFASELYEPRTVQGQIVLPTPQANTAIKMTEKIKENGKGQAGTRILLVSRSNAHMLTQHHRER